MSSLERIATRRPSTTSSVKGANGDGSIDVAASTARSNDAHDSSEGTIVPRLDGCLRVDAPATFRFNTAATNAPPLTPAHVPPLNGSIGYAIAPAAIVDSVGGRASGRERCSSRFDTRRTTPPNRTTETVHMTG